MSARKGSSASRLFGLAGLAVLAAMAAVRVRRSTGAILETAMGEVTRPSGGPDPGLKEELVGYIVGYGLALTLTIAAFAVVYRHWASPETTLGIVFGLGLVQIIVHFRCFLHVGLRASARDDLQLILFSALIVMLMVGGTLVVLFNLRMRMM